ncbi:MAG: transposase, partial [Dethiobacter sp.]|nr:transposase [Dethiobacter sp.]
RKHRGLYTCKDCGTVINADVNGAINIAKKYLETLNEQPVVVLGTPKMYRFDGCSFVA